VLRQGIVALDDPQFGEISPIPAVANVVTIPDRKSINVGGTRLTAHRTAGHTRGGTSWVWQSCEDTSCVTIVYADSQSPISADGFKYTRSTGYSTGIADFAAGAQRLDGLRCDILITPHPEASDLWQRLERRSTGDTRALIDPAACQRYAATARQRVAERVARESQP
jgi:metallo-beta-lactamase class B